MLPARHISISIARPWREVYEYAASPENLPKWAAGLDENAKITVAPPNEFGVIDHDVRLDDDTLVHVPLRVIANGEGAEVIFTLFQLPRMTARDIEHDAAAVASDLATLKSLLESPPPPPAE